MAWYRGGLVYVEEDDESLCLQYVRKKVRVFDWNLMYINRRETHFRYWDTIIDITDTSYDNFYDIDKNNLWRYFKISIFTIVVQKMTKYMKSQ